MSHALHAKIFVSKKIKKVICFSLVVGLERRGEGQWELFDEGERAVGEEGVVSTLWINGSILTQFVYTVLNTCDFSCYFL